MKQVRRTINYIRVKALVYVDSEETAVPLEYTSHLTSGSDRQLIKEANEGLEPGFDEENGKVVSILGRSVEKEYRIMSEEDFLKYSEVEERTK